MIDWYWEAWVLPRRRRRFRRALGWIAILAFLPFSGLALRSFSITVGQASGIMPGLIGGAIFMAVVWALERPRARRTVPAARIRALRARLRGRSRRAPASR